MMDAWLDTAVKVLCFDGGGVVLALAFSPLFWGVWQGGAGLVIRHGVGELVRV